MNNTIVRTLSGSVYIAIVIASTTLGGMYLVGFLLLALVLSTKETISLLRKSGGIFIGFTWLANISYFVVFARNYLDPIPHENELWPLLFLPIGLLLTQRIFTPVTQENKSALGNSFLTIGYMSLPLVLALKIANKDPFLILAIFIMLWATDTMAYIFGSWLGKHKLIERLSPNKTIEGFVAGVAGSLISAYIISLFSNHYPVWGWLLIGFLISLSGALGDLFESLLKRQAGVKDSGNVLPGHGGALDRLDSFLFAVPFGYFCMLLLDY